MLLSKRRASSIAKNKDEATAKLQRLLHTMSSRNTNVLAEDEEEMPPLLDERIITAFWNNCCTIKIPVRYYFTVDGRQVGRIWDLNVNDVLVEFDKTFKFRFD